MSHHRLYTKIIIVPLAVCVITSQFAVLPASAASSNISRSYNATESIKLGSLVSLDTKQSAYVTPATTANGAQLLGVALKGSDSLLAINSDEGNVQVATSGSVNTLVGSMNGDIKIGDQIAVSTVPGVGMKAESGNRIIGLAQTALTARTKGATEQTATDTSGKTHRLKIGYIKVAIGVGTAIRPGENASGLQQFAKTLTGKSISNTRVVISLIVALLASIALVTLIYAAIYSSIISIGRNPLAKFAIFRTLGGVLFMIVMLTVITAGTIYFLLR